MMDVMCKIIPLYRVAICIENKTRSGYEYVRHIVADTMNGLIEGIIDAELNENIDFGDEDVHMTFDIENFLYLPCKGTKRGFHLFDIETVDCAEWFGSSIDESIWYDCRFAGDYHPDPENLEAEERGAIYSEPRPVIPETTSCCDEQAISADEIDEYLKDKDAMIEAIYRASKIHPYREARLMEKVQRNAERVAKATDHVDRILKEEATRAAGQEGQNA